MFGYVPNEEFALQLRLLAKWLTHVKKSIKPLQAPTLLSTKASNVDIDIAIDPP
jgi:hypothetical protein